jgi:hypothetical protein
MTYKIDIINLVIFMACRYPEKWRTRLNIGRKALLE